MRLHLVTPPQPIRLYQREEGSVPEPHHYTFEKFEFDNSGKIQQNNKPKDKQESYVQRLRSLFARARRNETSFEIDYTRQKSNPKRTFRTVNERLVDIALEFGDILRNDGTTWHSL